MYYKFSLVFVLMISSFSVLSTQEYVIEISLPSVEIVQECHFGDEWSGYFSFGGEYTYNQYQNGSFILKPNQEFSLKSIIVEGNERHNDYEEITTRIAYEILEVGRYKYEEFLHIEDKNTGRYHCNSATFKFTYTISVVKR